MPSAAGAAEFVPDTLDLGTLARAADHCEGCELFAPATHTVFGEGPSGATVMLVGEQPGDSEDRAGEPFVGPAGRVLDQALAAAGIDRSRVYVTNAVKHFRFTTDDNSARRLHATPTNRHVRACRPWLDAELHSVRPVVVVALGATAGKALLGPDFRVTRSRGTAMDWPPPDGPFASSDVPVTAVVATIHPSAVLRTRGRAEREEAFESLVADLQVVANAMGS